MAIAPETLTMQRLLVGPHDSLLQPIFRLTGKSHFAAHGAMCHDDVARFLVEAGPQRNPGMSLFL